MVNLSYFTLSASAFIASTDAIPNPWNFPQTNNLARGTASQWQFKPRSEFYANNYYGSRNKIPEKYVKTGARTSGNHFQNGASSTSTAPLNSIFNWNNFSNRNLNKPTSVWSKPSYAVPKEENYDQFQRSIPGMRPMPGTNWDQVASSGPGMQQAIPDMRPMPGSNWDQPAGNDWADLPSSRPMPGTDWASESVQEVEASEPVQEVESSEPAPETEPFLIDPEPLSPVETELTEVTQTVTQVENAVETIMNEVSDIEAQVAILKEMSQTNVSIPELSEQVEAVIENVEAEFEEIEDQVSILEDIEADLETEEELIEEETDGSVEAFEDAYEGIVEEVVADSVPE